MEKVITHEEVNALISGVFPSDPKKAVLYGDLSTDERFVINPNNSVTNTPYTATQALLDADIRVRGSLTVTLNPASATVLSTATQMVFNITTGGTGTITNWTIISATLAGADRKANTSFNATHTQVTMTIPANTSYSSKVGAVQISVTTSDGTFNSNVAQITQNPASRLVFQNATSAQHSSATTTTQAFTNNNCTNVGVQSKSTGVNATISGSNVTITFPQNTTTSPVTRTVTISGKTADNVTTSTTHTITQQAAVSTNMVFTYNGGNLTSAAGSIPATDFTLTLTNATLTSVSSTGGITVVTGGTATSPTVRVSSYPANQSESEKSYTITLVARDIYGRDITKTVTIIQNADTYTFTVNPNPNQRGALDTSADFTVTHINVSDVGISTKSSEITSATYNNGGLSVSFPMNESSSSRDMTVTLTGKTVAGRVVNVIATVAQYGGGQANLGISYNGGSTRVSADGLDTSDFTIASNNVNITGYSANNGASIVESGQTNVTVRIPANNTDYEKEYTVTVSGTSLYDGRTLTATTTVYQEAPSPYLEISYAAGTSPVWSSTSANAYVYYEHVDKATIGLNSTGNVNVSSFNKGTEVTTGTYESEVSFTPNTGASRPITVVISAYTVDHSQIVTATATVNQGAYTSGSGYIHVTPDGTSIGAAATSVTYTVQWIGLKAGTTLSFTKDASMSSISKTSVSITASNWSGETTVTAQVTSYPSTASGSSTRNVTLTASGKGFANENISDTGYYKQSKSRSMFEFQNDFTVDWDVTSATITFTYAYLTNSSVSLAATGGAYFNSGLSQPSSSVSITPNASSHTGSFTIYFAKNDSPSQIEYVITATGNYGEAGESTSLNDSITVIHNIPDGASLVLTPCSTTYYWSTTNVTFNVDWTNISPGTSSNPGITITVSNGASATPNKYYSGDNGDEDFVVSGLAPGNSYTVTVTGRPYVGDNIVRTYTITIPDMPAPSIRVEPDGGSLLASATTATFTVYWSNISTSNQITIATTGVTGGASSFTPTSTSGSTTINATIAKNSGNSAKTITLSATGRALAGTATASDSGSYTQAKSTSKIVVERQNPTTSDIAYNRSSVTFRVRWTDVHGTISLELTSGSGTLSQNSISASGSDYADITVSNIPENTGTSTIRIRMDATATGIGGETVTDYHYYDQQVNTSNYEFTIEYTGSTVGSSSGSTDKFSIVTRNATVTGFTVDNGASVSASGASSVTISYPANQDEDNGVTYTVTMKGRTTFGNDVTATCTFKQYADSYTFTVVANTNPVAATATNTTFRVNYSYISNPGYYAATSQNINSCGTVGASGSNVQVGISANQSTSPKDIILVLSGVTDGGRTVYATGTTQQSGYVNPDNAYVNIGTLTLTACTNQSIYTVSGVNFDHFEIQDNSCGSTITSTGLNIGNMETMQDTDETEIPWVNGEHVINTLRGDNLTGRLYFYANGGENEIYIETSVWIDMTTECRGWFNDDLSSGNLWVFDYDLGEVASAGNVNFGNLDIGIYINGGDGDITLTYTEGYVENTGGTKHVTVKWHDMMSSGITISVTGNATVLSWGPNSFTGSNGSGTITINFGENGGPSSGSYVTTVAASGKTVLGTNKNKTVDIYQNGGYSPTGKVWIKSGENTVSFTNVGYGVAAVYANSPYEVQIDSTARLTVQESTIGQLDPNGVTKTCTGSLTPYTGTTYCFNFAWRYPSGTFSGTTTYYWKENDVQKSYVGDSNNVRTPTYTATTAIELSDFRVEVNIARIITLQFKHPVKATVLNKSTRAHTIGHLNFNTNLGNYYFDFSNEEVQPNAYSQTVENSDGRYPRDVTRTTTITLSAITGFYISITDLQVAPNKATVRTKLVNGNDTSFDLTEHPTGRSDLQLASNFNLGSVTTGVKTYDPEISDTYGIKIELYDS